MAAANSINMGHAYHSILCKHGYVISDLSFRTLVLFLFLFVVHILCIFLSSGHEYALKDVGFAAHLLPTNKAVQVSVRVVWLVFLLLE